jgi:hypothetical protein
MNESRLGQNLGGVLRCSLVDAKTGKVVRQFPKQHNLILNYGINRYYDETVTDFYDWNYGFRYAVGGDLVDLVDSGTGTASQSTNVVTTSSAMFTDNATDVGNVIHWDTGAEATITAFNSTTEVTVSNSATVVSGEFTYYKTNLTAPTSDSSGVITATQVGTTVTTSAPFFTNTATDAGKMIKWATGETAMIVTVTSTSQVEVIESQAVGPGVFTVYRTNQAGLTNELHRSNQYVTTTGGCGATWGANNFELSLFRTIDLPENTTEADVVYTEVGFASIVTVASNLFSRIKLANPITVVPGYKLRLFYTLTVSYTPATAFTKTLLLEGDWEDMSGTEGYDAIVPSLISTDGSIPGNFTPQFFSGKGVTNAALWLSAYSAAIPATPVVVGNVLANQYRIADVTNLGASGLLSTIQYVPSIVNIANGARSAWEAYVTNSGTRVYGATFSPSVGNTTETHKIRSIIFSRNQTGTCYLGFRVLLSSELIKLDTHKLTIKFRHTTTRTLS